jgi:hypothetical protein
MDGTPPGKIVPGDVVHASLPLDRIRRMRDCAREAGKDIPFAGKQVRQEIDKAPAGTPGESKTPGTGRRLCSCAPFAPRIRRESSPIP